MTTRPPKDESVSAETEKITQEILNLEKEIKECEQKIRQLRDQEDPSKNLFFPQEIFNLQQKKLMLKTEVEIRRKKINRLTFTDF